MAAAYDVLELSTAVKPWLLRHMLRTHDDGGGIAYFDPDIQVVDAADGARARRCAEHRARADAAPHRAACRATAASRARRTSSIAGVLQPRLHRAAAGRDDADALLDWWSERLLTRLPRRTRARAASSTSAGSTSCPGLVADFDDPARPGLQHRLLEPADAHRRSDDGGALHGQRRAAALLPLQRLRPRQARPS